jgi:hypothetical protein
MLIMDMQGYYKVKNLVSEGKSLGFSSFGKEGYGLVINV